MRPKHYQSSLCLLLKLLFVFAIKIMAIYALALPPWRGPRQLLSIGPWGPILDAYSSTLKNVLWIDVDGSSQLVPLEDLPSRPDGHRRVVAISDTHGKHRFVPIPPCDVLVHCGDILQRYGFIGDLGGGLGALLDFSSWLGNVAAKNKVVIGGNHDRLLEKLGDTAVQNILKSKSGAIYLHDNSVVLDDIVIHGSPWSPPGMTGNSAFQQQRVGRAGDNNEDAIIKEISIALESKHPHIDVLLTHASCQKWEAVVQTKGTAFWAHGHWHDGQGQTKVHKNGCVSVNVASNDMLYRPQNPPTVFDVPIRRNTSKNEYIEWQSCRALQSNLTVIQGLLVCHLQPVALGWDSTSATIDDQSWNDLVRSFMVWIALLRAYKGTCEIGFSGFFLIASAFRRSNFLKDTTGCSCNNNLFYKVKKNWFGCVCPFHCWSREL